MNEREALPTTWEARAKTVEGSFSDVAQAYRACARELRAALAQQAPAVAAGPATQEGLPVEQEPKYTVNGSAIVNRHTGVPVPADEPVFVFRARDALSVPALRAYLVSIDNREPASMHANAVRARIADFERFAVEQPHRMKWPDTTTAAQPTEPAQPATRSQRLTNAGYTRRPTANSLPPDDDAQPTPCAGPSCGTTTAQHSAECAAEHAAACAPVATQGQAVYQVRGAFANDPKWAWRDAFRDVFDLHPAECRRVLYTTPQPTAPAAAEQARVTLLREMVQKAIKTADNVGQSRGSNRYAQNTAAVVSLVDLIAAIDAAFDRLQAPAPVEAPQPAEPSKDAEPTDQGPVTREYLTIVFAWPTDEDIAILQENPRMTAASWSHAIHDRDAARVAQAI